MHSPHDGSTRKSDQSTLCSEIPLKEEPIENYRPAWLHGMELDLYFERSAVAFEFQGDQHYEAGIFGDHEKLRAQRNRDQWKAMICKKAKIHLAHVRAADLNSGRILGKLIWSRKTFNRLKRQRLFCDLSSLSVLCKEVNVQAEDYCRNLRRKYDSATACRGPARSAALKRHKIQ